MPKRIVKIKKGCNLYHYKNHPIPIINIHILLLNSLDSCVRITNGSFQWWERSTTSVNLSEYHCQGSLLIGECNL